MFNGPYLQFGWWPTGIDSLIFLFLLTRVGHDIARIMANKRLLDIAH